MEPSELCHAGALAAGFVTALVYAMLARGKPSHRVCYAVLMLCQLLKVLFEVAARM
jgi:hypothetical protein